jgi:hypothetical protein
MNIKSLFAKLLVGIIPFISGCASNLPIEVPIDLSKEGDTVEFEAVITKADYYQFMLHFYTPQRRNDPAYKEEYNVLYDALSSFVGKGSYKTHIDDTGKKVYIYDTGQIIPIRVMIYKINRESKELISDKIYDTRGNNGLAFRDTGDFIFRRITSYDFEKGRYFIKVENMKGFEFMNNKRSTMNLLKYRQKV